MHRRSFILGLASIVAAPAVLAQRQRTSVDSEMIANQVFDFRRGEFGVISFSRNNFSCCRFLFDTTNTEVHFIQNYVDDCSFEGVYSLIETESNNITENIFDRCWFDGDIEHRRTPAFHKNTIIGKGGRCSAPTI